MLAMRLIAVKMTSSSSPSSCRLDGQKREIVSTLAAAFTVAIFFSDLPPPLVSSSSQVYFQGSCMPLHSDPRCAPGYFVLTARVVKILLCNNRDLLGIIGRKIITL